MKSVNLAEKLETFADYWQPGELFVVPQGVEHCPFAEEEAHVLVIERTGTPNTGDPGTAAPRRVI
jgi:uncharacterized RmlC-like cupin family protein